MVMREPTGFHPEVASRQSDAELRAAAYLDRTSAALLRALYPGVDPIERAIEVFPHPGERRSDPATTRQYSPQESIDLREAALQLGPHRPTNETVEMLGVGVVDAHIIESGQLHKVAAEMVLAVDPNNPAPIIAIASDRPIPVLRKKKNPEDPEIPKDSDHADPELLSTFRLLAVGGRDVGNPAFYRRCGAYDAVEKPTIDDLRMVPGTEYEATKQFMQSMTGFATQEVLPIGYDPDTGQLIESETGQLTYLGHYQGSPFYILRKDPTREGKNMDTASTMALACEITSTLLNRQLETVAYHTSATYKPSRAADALKCALAAEQEGRFEPRIVVPNYGTRQLADIKGDPYYEPTIGQVVAELRKAAETAKQIRQLLASAG